MMKPKKKILTGLFWVLIMALLVAPLWMIYQISAAEMKEYETPSVPELNEMAIGGVAEAVRTDLSEFVTVNGTFGSETYAYMELTQENLNDFRWEVSTGQEIQEGDVLATYGEQKIVSTVTGILAERNTYGAMPYLRFKLFTPVEMSCVVSSRVLSILKSAETLTTQDGAKVTLTFASKQKNADGSMNIRLAIDTDQYTFGQYLQDLQISTDKVYRKTLVLPVDCVYQKTAGDEMPWYVRQVTQDGIFLQEVEVSIGYSDGTRVCVNGVEEGQYFDTGYKAIAGG